jgi:creatinine amidohydrolase
VYLSDLTTEQAKTVLKQDPVVVIPVGSTEQHGPQCGLGTDFIIPTYLAEQIAQEENVVVAPTVPYGVCPYHQDFAGSIDIGYEGLYLVLYGITSSLMRHGVRRFLILNGHGGNNPSIDKAALKVYRAGGICASIDWWTLVGQLDTRFRGGHGDAIETSAMMAVKPEAVHLELCRPMDAQSPSENTGASSIQSVSFRGGVVRLPRATKENAPNGWFGPLDPADSTREMGEEMMQLVTAYIRGFLKEFRSF